MEAAERRAEIELAAACSPGYTPIGLHPSELAYLRSNGYGHAKRWKLLARHAFKHGSFKPKEFSRNKDPMAPLFTDLEVDYDKYRSGDKQLVFKVVWPDLASTSKPYPNFGSGAKLDHE